MNEHGLVSIGMPVYNCESTVAEAIASILNQSFENWELIVYDDGSKDGTLSVARQFSDPRIHVIEGIQNSGLPTILNKIIARCEGQYFARMDGDDIAYPNRIQSQLEFLENHPDVDLVAGSILVFSTRGGALGVRRGGATHKQICTKPWSGIPMAHPTWMGRMEWFHRNPYDAKMVRMEDWELLFRTHRHSRFANLPEIVLGYREESLSISKIIQARRHICARLLRSSWEDNTPFQAARGIAGQIARIPVDISAIGLNLNYLILRHRAPSIAPAEFSVWLGVLERTRRTVLERSALNKADYA